MSDPVSIDPKPDGPLQINGPIPLANSSGEVIATEARYWLCRCGGSDNKPFCDGTHQKLGFSSARQSDPALRATVDYVGKKITIHDNRSICAHAGHCTDHLPEVFRMKEEPWIDADAKSVAETVATIKTCPSGALAYSVDGVRREHTGRAAAIHITKDGPYAVVGGPQLKGDAAPVVEEHYTLCRCGQSKNKPFCDGAHWAAGFKDNRN
ncbi:MAG: CDGSH iron-sulfur domain-containing protein [Burkholderiales bacterium]